MPGNDTMETPDRETTIETYTVTVTAPSESTGTILEAVAGLDDVTVRDVQKGNRRTARIDPDQLTETQWETLVRAVAAGYYSIPRTVTLAMLSQEFDVTDSAVSQRLRKAEATIVRQVVAGISPEHVE